MNSSSESILFVIGVLGAVPVRGVTGSVGSNSVFGLTILCFFEVFEVAISPVATAFLLLIRGDVVECSGETQRCLPAYKRVAFMSFY